MNMKVIKIFVIKHSYDTLCYFLLKHSKAHDWIDIEAC